MFRLRHKKVSSGGLGETAEVRNRVEGGSQRLSRGELLKRAAMGLGAVVAAGVGGSKVVRANTGDPVTLGNSGDGVGPNLAEDATEVQYDGAGAPGVVLLAQADNSFVPSQASFPAAVAGWTRTNASIPNGVYGYSERPGGNGIVGSGFFGARAGLFNGNVQVNGALSVTGPKNALVPHPDGLHRRLYSLESPESWFEDFGAGALTEGEAQVPLDPEFAVLVHNDSYQVFLTEYGESKGLYVSNRTTSGFTVRERDGGKSSVAFGYRAVARRKDIPGPRLERVSVSAVPEQRERSGSAKR